MAKKVEKVVKLQIPAGKATPAPQLVQLLVKQVLTSWDSLKNLTLVQLIKLA